MGKVSEFISRARGQLLVCGLGMLALLMVFTVSTSGSYASSPTMGAGISAQVDGEDMPEAHPTGTLPRFVRICAFTGHPHRPYIEIWIPRWALPWFLNHGAIYPVPPGGCPAFPPPIPTHVQTQVPPPVATRTPRPPHATRTPRPPHPTRTPRPPHATRTHSVPPSPISTQGPGSDK